MSAGSRKIVVAALMANLGIAAAKFAAAFLTGSSAMLAEAVHSVADSANQLFLLLGIRLSSRNPTRLHPFGFGMERYFWSFVVALTLFSMGALFSTYEGVRKIFDPHPLESFGLSMAVLAVGFILEGVSFRAAWKEFRHQRGPAPTWSFIRKTKDPVTITVLFEDSAALIGLSVAFAGIVCALITGNALFDGAASVIIGLLLGGVAFLLAWESKSLLIGEAASEEDVALLSAVVDETEGVAPASDIITMQLSPTAILVNLALDFDERLDSTRVEDLTADIERRMKAALPAVAFVFIEAASVEGGRRDRKNPGAGEIPPQK